MHIESLFSSNVDWDLIATHLPDMLRVGDSTMAASEAAPTRSAAGRTHRGRPTVRIGCGGGMTVR